MAETRIGIKKAMVDWAFGLTDLSDEKKAIILDETRWLQKDFNNYLNPTVNQLSLFATKLHVPFGNLLLDTPPKLESIRLAFRTQNNAPATVSLNVRETIYEMQRKQAWFKHESGYALEHLDFVGVAKNIDLLESLQILKRLVKWEHCSSPRELYNDLRDKIAKLGVLVMQKGGVGLGTNRPIDVRELRAFVMLDEYAPLIFINQKDSYTARVFSLIHEFVHILRGTDELLNEIDKDVQEERIINGISASFLMPECEFVEKFSTENLDKTAKYFNVSSEAAAIRAYNLNLINSVDEVKLDNGNQLANKKKKSGGNPYKNALSLNDGRYMAAVVSAQDTGRILPTQAASLIGISLKMLDKTVQNYNEREATK
ncbi:ImmA/IrrE family metallo-endopeptidase [Leuconostoc suionicum]|uniref:ImmA/IrrE family metallo-endopeptidase n=1 Tax=Leuconostoc suionicum TaxID=1511761 RepID=UPI0021A9A1C3|nr:ImmA/IrrE family metallo-endopeptidase [Leuconostoc suionicum]MCT4382755.1 ImmA/IrrE family metallo-endopeptidase [Leuconostoc suionicum]